MLSIRKIGVIGRTYRHLGRYRQILGVMLKYGFGDLLEVLHIDWIVRAGRSVLHKEKIPKLERLTRAERIRRAAEELGPTFIKLGQMLSTRPDLVPPDLVRELAKLQDEVPSFEFSEARRILEEELEKPVLEIFSYIDETPIASASIGQVHKGRLMGGGKVAVKVQRPGIRDVIEVDLEIMNHLATLMERHVEEASLHRPVRIVEEFARTLERELDYAIEAGSMERFSRQFAGDETVRVPGVFLEASTGRVLTTEFISGVKITDTDRLKAMGVDLRALTKRGAELYFRQVFDFGFFHADPHPGNIFVGEGGVIHLVDFGMTGFVDTPTKERFVDLLNAVVNRDAENAARGMLRLTRWEQEPDMRALTADAADFMDRHLYKPLKDIEIGRLVQHLLETASRHHLGIPPNIFLMMKTLSTIEGVARVLDPKFDMIETAVPFVERIKLQRYSPTRLAADAQRLAVDMAAVANYLPKNLLEISRLARKGRFTIRTEMTGLDPTISALHKISNRLAFSIIIAALIIGSALMAKSGVPPLIGGISVIGIIGFISAAVLGGWLLVAIIKKGL